MQKLGTEKWAKKAENLNRNLGGKWELWGRNWELKSVNQNLVTKNFFKSEEPLRFSTLG
jgi:hypothetical protein